MEPLAVLLAEILVSLRALASSLSSINPSPSARAGTCRQ